MESKLYTRLLDFRLDNVPTKDEVISNIISPLEKLFGGVYNTEGRTDQESLLSVCFYGVGLFGMVRIYDREHPQEKVLMTLLLESKKPLDEDEEGIPLENLERVLSDRFKTQPKDVHFFPSIKRCRRDATYFKSSDSRIMEYNCKEVLFSEQSPFQYIQIFDTEEFGKQLILDKYPNMAESDVETYTHSLMGLQEGFSPKYKDSQVLILGGGDGNLLKELLALPNPPAYVKMIEIDEMVMEAVDAHIPSLCGPYLKKENREGPNYKIITGDAIAFMEKELSEGAQYDFIFGDLTDVPIYKESYIWDFLHRVVCVRLLKPETGYYMTHCNGINAKGALANYESFIKKLDGGKCTFTTSSRFVNSFYEIWVFYQIQRHE